MKKTLLCLMAIFSMISASFAQTQRLVMIEEFISCYDSNGASQNPNFNVMMSSNPTECTAIRYHVYWPNANEPMYVHSSADVNSRLAYYNNNEIPKSYFDGLPPGGLSYTGCPYNITQAKIDSEYSIPSPFAMQMQHRLNTAQDSIFITLLIRAMQPVTGAMAVQTAEIEKMISFATPPGGTTESIFYNVMVKMFPSGAGQVLPSSWNTGDYVLLQYKWKLPSTIYDKSQLAAVAWVQRGGTRTVLQAVNSSAAAVVPVYARDATIVAIKDVPQNACSNSLSPAVTIQNNGNLNLTSLNIKYRVNNSAQSTYAWSGNLTPLQRQVVTLPACNFILGSANTFYVKVSDPNGLSDLYPGNDSTQVSFVMAGNADQSVYLDLKTDNDPQETTWTLKKSTGQTIGSGGPYTQATTAFSYDYVLTAGCYIFTLNDAGGNGLDHGNGSGYYNLYDATGNVICQGTSFGAQVMYSFNVITPGTEEESNVREYVMYPNPIHQQFNLGFYIRKPASAMIEVFNDIGEKLFQKTYTDIISGQNNLVIGAENLAPGVYLLKVRIGDEVKNFKFNKIN